MGSFAHMARPAVDPRDPAKPAAPSSGESPRHHRGTDLAGSLPGGAWLAAGTLTGVLLAFAGRFGFHRDELYFIEAGRHPAWGYPDQPPLVPLFARVWYDATGGMLLTFRIVPGLLAGAIVLVTALISRQLGGSQRDQVGTAVATAVCSLVVAVGHLFSTTTFDLLGTVVVVLLLIRALDAPPGPDLAAWLWVGIAAGVTMQIKTLLATALVAVLIGLLAVGPRGPLLRPGPWVAAIIAGLFAAPNLAWQAANGWPQLELSRAIAAGSSATSVDRPLLIPMHYLTIGPVIGVVALTGLVTLLRSPRLRRYRWLAVAYLAHLVILVASGGKPYYSAAFLLVLIAVGVPPILDLVTRSRWWAVPIGGLLAVHVVMTAVITLPLTSPASELTAFANDVNPDVGETIGWDRFADTVARVAAEVPPRERSTSIVLTRNYGQAGALDRARDEFTDLLPVYSGHNGYGDWGPPRETVTTVVLVGWTSASDGDLARWFRECTPKATIDNGVGLENEEQGTAVRICRGTTKPWPQLWPELNHLG
jgi:hypothetical protein